MYRNKVIFMLLFLSTTRLFSGIWSVNNNDGEHADYIGLQEAHDGCSAGDTLYVYGSTLTYGSLTMSKQLTIIGPGYFLSENEDTQYKKLTASITGSVIALSINTGAEGSIVTGMDISPRVDINCGNVTLKRNIIRKSSGIETYALNVKASNVLILQNYLKSQNSRGTVTVGSYKNNVIIANNYTSGGKALNSSQYSSILFYNNILCTGIRCYNSEGYNNIQISGGIEGENNNFYNNIGHSTQFGTENNNQSNVDMTTVFIDSGSTDARWRLSTGSPAIGAGVNGEDCGMFGGADPYKLSGVPAIPAIYYFESPISGSEAGGLPVHVKIKAHD